jgi:hypothetical protein
MIYVVYLLTVSLQNGWAVSFLFQRWRSQRAPPESDGDESMFLSKDEDVSGGLEKSWSSEGQEADLDSCEGIRTSKKHPSHHGSLSIGFEDTPSMRYRLNRWSSISASARESTHSSRTCSSGHSRSKCNSYGQEAYCQCLDRDDSSRSSL